jgi:hypothetical protein
MHTFISTRTLLAILYGFSLTGLSAQANYQEEDVPDYVLPDILIRNNGKEVTRVEEWEGERKPEILAQFEEHVYGRFPAEQLRMRAAVADQNDHALCGLATRKNVTLTFSNDKGESRTVDLIIWLPTGVEQPVPVFLGLNFYGNHTVQPDPEIPITENYVRNNVTFNIFDHRADDLSRGVRAYRWPLHRILARGFGLATLYSGDLDPDYDDGFENGLHALVQASPPGVKDEWSTLSAWSYGLSKAMDYLVTDPRIDAGKVAVIGHSRMGKAALWAGAKDERFSLVISNDSGCGGAALSRRAYGETVKAINDRFPHWFGKRFRDYSEKEGDLPVDQHMLLGLMAPRALYVASAEDDQWADPKGEYLSLFHAAPVYQLFGLETFGDAAPPAVNKARVAGQTAYHVRTGEHDITPFDWERYMDFADKIWEK